MDRPTTSARRASALFLALTLILTLAMTTLAACGATPPHEPDHAEPCEATGSAAPAPAPAPAPDLSAPDLAAPVAPAGPATYRVEGQWTATGAGSLVRGMLTSAPTCDGNGVISGGVVAEVALKLPDRAAGRTCSVSTIWGGGVPRVWLPLGDATRIVCVPGPLVQQQASYAALKVAWGDGPWQQYVTGDVGPIALPMGWPTGAQSLRLRLELLGLGTVYVSDPMQLDVTCR